LEAVFLFCFVAFVFLSPLLPFLPPPTAIKLITSLSMVIFSSECSATVGPVSLFEVPSPSISIPEPGTVSVC
jgi:hypothetical protein